MAKSEVGRNSGRNSLPLNNMCWTVAKSAGREQRRSRAEDKELFVGRTT